MTSSDFSACGERWHSLSHLIALYYHNFRKNSKPFFTLSGFSFHHRFIWIHFFGYPIRLAYLIPFFAFLDSVAIQGNRVKRTKTNRNRFGFWLFVVRGGIRFLIFYAFNISYFLLFVYIYFYT